MEIDLSGAPRFSGGRPQMIRPGFSSGLNIAQMFFENIFRF
jgi:hypothetical protein